MPKVYRAPAGTVKGHLKSTGWHQMIGGKMHVQTVCDCGEKTFKRVNRFMQGLIIYCDYGTCIFAAEKRKETAKNSSGLRNVRTAKEEVRQAIPAKVENHPAVNLLINLARSKQCITQSWT